MTVGAALARAWLMALCALFAVPVPVASAEEGASSPQRRVDRTVRAPDARRDWEVQLTWEGRKLTMTCVRAMTGRCGVRLVDAPRMDSSPADLHVEWLGVPAGRTVERRLTGAGYGLCLSTTVGDDSACEPVTALHGF